VVVEVEGEGAHVANPRVHHKPLNIGKIKQLALEYFNPFSPPMWNAPYKLP
jgi:hypothetical protein